MSLTQLLLSFQVNAEFLRITTVPLETKFMAQLDTHAGRLVEIIGSKTGAVQQKTSKFLKAFNQTVDINTWRENLLTIYFGEDFECLFKEYLDANGVEAEEELEQQSMAIFVIRSEGDPDASPADIGIVIDGVTVLNDLPSIYALNLQYPKGLERTFEFFQKVIMQLDPGRMSGKVRGLNTKLYPE